MPSYDFSGRVAVVTGAARGLGKAAAARLAASGATLVLWDRDATALERTAAEFAGRAHAAQVDQSDDHAVARATQAAMAAHGRIDILINNAAIVGPQKPVWEFDPAAWREVIDIDLIGQFHCCRHVIPHMRDANYGRVVNMTSLAGKEGHANLSAYCAAKAGILALTKCLAKEVATYNILVNAVAPGTIESESLAAIDPSFHEAVLRRTPMARFGRAEEVAAMVCFLCSDEPSFTTGALFDVSGGRTGYQ